MRLLQDTLWFMGGALAGAVIVLLIWHDVRIAPIIGIVLGLIARGISRRMRTANTRG